MRVSDDPRARAASTNSRSFSARTWPRTSRATPIQPNTVNRKMMNRNDVLSPTIGSRKVSSPRKFAHDEQRNEERERQEDVGDTHQEVVEHARRAARRSHPR